MSTPSETPRILVADDHEWIRNIVVQVIRQTLPAADVIVTADGLQALESFRRVGCQFLVSNHSMPHMDGASLIRAVREQDPDLPVLMISVNPDAESDAMEAGANWFLKKEDIMEQMPPLLRRYSGGDTRLPVQG